MENVLYEESVSSARTQAVFWSLTALFLILSVWRAGTTGWNLLSSPLLLGSLFFLFYCLNYRTLVIHLTARSLTLRFGLFGWTIPLQNVEEFRLDDLSGLMRYGGAGIHFMYIGGRYRVSFNFLEYPRVLISLKRSGIVRDVSFTTRQPERLVTLLEAARSGSVA
jgi:hypothetical protein